MKSINYKNINYILADCILEKAPIFSKGVRSSRDLIKKKNIDVKDYVFARLKDNKWEISDGKSAKYDRVFLVDNLVKNIPELNNTNEKVTDDKGVEKAPEIIQLEDHEKFQDENGNPVEIETRGERHFEKIYFKVKDVANGFNMDNLYTTLIGINSGYQINKDYKYFICTELCNSQSQTGKKTKMEKELFLTYTGIVRLLCISRSGCADKFQKWAFEKLFTLQMGTTIQKQQLVSNILGVNAKVIKEVFNTTAHTIPCVYLFSLNTVKELRQSMSIDNKYTDDSIVCKYGFTKDLSRRTTEHLDTFNKIINCDLKLKYHSYIDPQYISKGESDIRQFMEALNINFNYKNYEELVIIPKNLMNLVQKQYEQIGKSYMGHISELITNIKELKDKYEKQELKHQLELQQLQNKDIQLLEYKIKFLELAKNN
jgi:hypothetical protein